MARGCMRVGAGPLPLCIPTTWGCRYSPPHRTTGYTRDSSPSPMAPSNRRREREGIVGGLSQPLSPHTQDYTRTDQGHTEETPRTQGRWLALIGLTSPLLQRSGSESAADADAYRLEAKSPSIQCHALTTSCPSSEYTHPRSPLQDEETSKPHALRTPVGP